MTDPYRSGSTPPRPLSIPFVASADLAHSRADGRTTTIDHLCGTRREPESSVSSLTGVTPLHPVFHAQTLAQPPGCISQHLPSDLMDGAELLLNFSQTPYLQDYSAHEDSHHHDLALGRADSGTATIGHLGGIGHQPDSSISSLTGVTTPCLVFNDQTIEDQTLEQPPRCISQHLPSDLMDGAELLINFSQTAKFLDYSALQDSHHPVSTVDSDVRLPVRFSQFTEQDALNSYSVDHSTGPDCRCYEDSQLATLDLERQSRTDVFRQQTSIDMVQLGLRVVRGPDWQWQNQDGGEGHVGTVVEVGKSDNSNTPDKTVIVEWDSACRENYRVGSEGFFDLRVLDQAPTGVKHTNICCASCKQKGILGTRWRCSQCLDVNLCHTCYMNDKHDLNHAFVRYDTSCNAQPGVKVGKRAEAVRVEARGIFVGAKVVRGSDWHYGNQDGGVGKQGQIVGISDCNNESGRSIANVWWDCGPMNVYRLGHKGKIDLKYVVEASGGYYYRDHLLKLGDSVESSLSTSAKCSFKVGDKVRVDLDVDILKVKQEGHGGWNPEMAECIGKVGIVRRITECGDICVRYGGSRRWRFYAGALTKVSYFEVGDAIRIIENGAIFRDLQQGRMDCTDSAKFKSILGRIGIVFQVLQDEDLLVRVGEQVVRLNPKCCIWQQHYQEELNNTLERSNDCTVNHTNRTPHVGLDELLWIQQSSIDDPEKLVRAAAEGDLEVVQEILRKDIIKVDVRSSGKTALQVAARQGHINIVQSLLEAGANLHVQDNYGNTALHYSAFGDQSEVMSLLLQFHAPINALNSRQCSALHIAVNKQYVRCVKVLIEYKCDVNIQDSYGDTALHDAISNDNTDLIELLMSRPSADLELRNSRGFNVLHLAALKGNSYATEKIVMKARQLVNLKKDDGFTALHLAALNGHLKTANVLLDIGQACIEITNNRKQTPLLLAVSQGHAPLVELLVDKGANVMTSDENGVTCLHLALNPRISPDGVDRSSPKIHQIYCELEREIDNAGNLAIACFLIQHGAKIDVQNRRHVSPLALVTNVHKVDILRKFIRNVEDGVTAAVFVVNGNVVDSSECIMCSDGSPEVIFRPCGHRIVCVPCSVRMKKCMQCFGIITSKIGPGDKEMCKRQWESMENAELMELRSKITRLKQSQRCSICWLFSWNVAFLCGHTACSKCAEALKVCHLCRKPIHGKINIFT